MYRVKKGRGKDIGIYSGLLLSSESKNHLILIQEEERFDLLVEQMAEREKVTE